MAITNDEKTAIINEVLQAIKTNSRTIDQLSAVTSVADTDCIELSGGKKVSYAVLRGLLKELSDNDIQDLRTAINNAESGVENNKLKLVNITVTADTATLLVETNGISKTCTIPIATSNGVGLMTPTTLGKVNTTYTIATKNKSQIDAINNSIGSAGGICPLDEQGKVDPSYIPEQVGRIYSANFDGFSDSTNASAETLNASSTDTGVTIIFDRYLQAFVAVKAFKAYRNWKDSADFGSNRGAGSEPYNYALYVNKTSDTIWKYIDGEMTQVGADMNEVRQYVAQAQEHADNAEQSVTDAAKWATSASDSATLASESAEQASASATAAEKSNTESKANAHSAFLMASNAQNAANEAVECMNAASASATSASESAASASASKEEVANAITEHQAEMSTFSEQCKYRYVTLNFGANEETMQLANINGPALVLETVIMSNVERVYMTTSLMVKEDITGYTASSSTTSKIIEAYSFATFDIVRSGSGTASVGLKFKVQ